MLARYTLPRMGSVWEPENRFRKWLEIEILACEAQAKLGVIPEEVVEAIRRKAGFDVDRIEEVEKETRHDVVAFLTDVAEWVGEEARFIHLGLTSYDIVDTALSLQLQEAADILLEDLEGLQKALRAKALEHKLTLMMGRTHGVHAEPTTFGLKMAIWYQEMRRNRRRLETARETISYGKLSGAVGTMAQIDPFVEEYVCQRLGLKPAPVSSQILQRDRHAEYMSTLAIIASSLEKFSTEIRNLQRTEILEVEEGFAKRQKGSSAMPHKRNPIVCERISGLARVVRSNALAAMEDVNLWHERDLTNSAPERVIIPDSTILVDYMLAKFTEVIENLVVYPQNMLHNLQKSGGIIFSQPLLLELTKKGVSREEAYSLVQNKAMKAWETEQDFTELVLGDEEIRKHLSEEKIRRCFDPARQLKNVDYIFQRAGIE